MPNYHLNVSHVSRSGQQKATAAAAYRAGELVVDERSGKEFDYTRKAGVLHSELVMPAFDGEGGRDRIEPPTRSEFWNGVEMHHKRGDATLAREVEVSLPAELDAPARQALALQLARELADEYGVAVDVSLHAPRRVTDAMLARDPDQHFVTEPDGSRHNGNWHAHLLASACSVDPMSGKLGKKVAEMDAVHCQRHAGVTNIADRFRGRWADMQNAALERAGQLGRVDHRTLAAQGIEREPQVHLGPAAAGYTRRTGQPSQVSLAIQEEAGRRLELAQRAGQAVRVLDKSIFDLSANLAAALAARQRAQFNEMTQRGAARKPAPEPVFAKAPTPAPVVAKPLTPTQVLQARIEGLVAAKPGRSYHFVPVTPGHQYSGVVLLVDPAHRAVVIEHGSKLIGLQAADAGGIAEGRLVIARVDQAEGKWNVTLHPRELELDKQRALDQAKIAKPQFSSPPAAYSPNEPKIAKPQFGEVPGRRPRGPSHGR